MNKKVRGIMSPGQLAESMATRVCKTDGPMKSVKIGPKERHSVTGRAGSGGGGGKKSSRY